MKLQQSLKSAVKTNIKLLSMFLILGAADEGLFASYGAGMMKMMILSCVSHIVIIPIILITNT
jgi:hypothetical protein